MRQTAVFHDGYWIRYDSTQDIVTIPTVVDMIFCIKQNPIGDIQGGDELDKDPRKLNRKLFIGSFSFIFQLDKMSALMTVWEERGFLQLAVWIFHHSSQLVPISAALTTGPTVQLCSFKSLVIPLLAGLVN